MVSPAHFIPVAEETGLIVPIGEWVLSEACRQHMAWRAAGLPPLPVAVNLSPRQFREPNLVATISRILSETGTAPAYLALEITEGSLMQMTEHTLATLDALHDLGVSLSIDDFGVGYSSLSYLKRFPVDQLKIDQSFVRDIATDPDDAAIVSAIIGLAHNLKLSVVAEGVETEEQLAYVAACGCNEVQGYYFSRPLPANEAAARFLATAN
jgi:EAL domain-containing protein (putative c-di-GMP-specific phosphodiesterase class I)